MNVVLALKSGNKFRLGDVRMLASRIRKHYQGNRLCVYCIWPGTAYPIQLPEVRIIPAMHDWPGWWIKMNLFAPEYRHLRPFLYMDLDMAVVGDIGQMVNALPDKDGLIFTEDFYQSGKLSSSMIWFPDDSQKVAEVWRQWRDQGFPVKEGRRMDHFFRSVITPDGYWQQYTDGLYTFKPNRGRNRLTELPDNAVVVDFHGRSGIKEAAKKVEWVKRYVDE